MARSDSAVWTEITESRFVGETDNLGLIDEPYGRSLSRGGPQDVLQGVKFYQGPVFVSNSYFTNYEERTWNGFFRPAGAISFKRHNQYPSKAHNSVKGIKFGFCDKTGGNWVYNGNSSVKFFSNDDGNRQITFNDIDGSVTGRPDSQVVKSHRFFTTPCCSHRDTWNMDVCPHQYAKLKIKGEGGPLDPSKIKDYPIKLFRDDRPNDPFALEGTKGLNYLVIKGKSYIINFNGTAPDKVKLEAQNLFPGDSIRVGLCFPKDVTSFTFTGSLPRITKDDPMFSVTTITELDSDTTGRAYFWDVTTGLLFVKIIGFHNRVDGEKCPGYQCPGVNIIRNDGSSIIADCFDAAYTGAAPYKKPDSCSKAVPDPLPCPSPLPSPEGYGMTVVPSIEDVPKFVAQCPGPVAHPGRGTVEYMGCFIDTTLRDLPHLFQTLFRSMTPDFCIERQVD
ncbi:cell surface hyaluronidase-like [Gigantopelta aegis]|uniref:cell surface hyaluronidase-like n=1 Tax=Gigantopelta aegis TaxID=1735272 RepID=UPI001B88A48E|nr:cell surface hyaluronidase-like [Gigantopelta aegis]